MEGHWILTDKEKTIRIEKKLCHKKWENNTSGIAETIVLLELITTIANKSEHANSGKILIGHDNKKSHNKIVNKIVKLSLHAQEGSAEIVMMKKKLKMIKFEVEIKHAKSH